MGRPKTRLTKQHRLIIILVISLICFLALAFMQNPSSELNRSVNLWAESLQFGIGFTQTACLISGLFETSIMLVFSLPFACLLFYKKHKAQAVLLVAVMGANAVLLSVIKTLIASPRPLNGIILENGFSFPSGHVTSVIVLFGMLTYFVWQNQKTLRPKIAMASLTSVLAVAVGFDRIYLNVHWLTDVLAAPFLALFLIAVSILFMQTLTSLYKKGQGAVFEATPKFRAHTLNGRAITNRRYNTEVVN